MHLASLFSTLLEQTEKRSGEKSRHRPVLPPNPRDLRSLRDARGLGTRTTTTRLSSTRKLTRTRTVKAKSFGLSTHFHRVRGTACTRQKITHERRGGCRLLGVLQRVSSPGRTQSQLLGWSARSVCLLLRGGHEGLALRTKSFQRAGDGLYDSSSSGFSESMNSTCVKGKCPTRPFSSPSHWPLMLVLVTVMMSPTSNLRAVLS